MQDHTPSPTQQRYWGWLPTEVPWLLGIAVLFYCLGGIDWNLKWEGFAYDPVLRLYVPIAFIAAAIYSLLDAIPAWKPTFRLQFRAVWVIEIALCIAAVLYVAYIDPILYVDDAGFILRYFDHFADGQFFTYNAGDGPVFGLSSFIYGLLGGLITWAGFLDSEGALNFLVYLGTFCTAFLYFRILRKVSSSAGIVVVAWVLLMTCSRSMALIYNSGMEAPIHFSIVLTAILFFLHKRDRLMWLFMALAVISKLDAVPLVSVMIVFWTIENWKDLIAFDWHKRRYHDALMYGLVPILVWIVFAWIVFGSPLPQSAYAKIHFHNHAKGSWFPFLETFVYNGYRTPFFAVTMVLFIAQVGYVAATRKGGRGLVFGFAFIATLLLYYFYNPGERMVWYYVLPEGLMLLQLVMSLQWFWGWIPGNGRLTAVWLTMGCAFLFISTNMWNEIEWTRSYKQAVEGERARIGDYIQQQVGPNDTLQSGHGLISRKAKGYVVDETGLNFRADTTSKHRNVALWERYRPHWIVMHGFSWEVDKLNNFSYALDTSFFEICRYGNPGWRIFKRTPTIEESEATYFVNLDRLQGEELKVIDEPQHFLHVIAKAYTFLRKDYNIRESKLTMGVLRHEFPYKIHVSDVLQGDTTIWEHTYFVDSMATPNSPMIMPLTIPLLRKGIPATRIAGPRYIILRFENSYGPVQIYDPAVSILRRDP